MIASKSLEANNPAHFTPQPGDPFNPWRGVCGFYPPDAVSRLRDVIILETRRRLTNGHKRLYTLLVRRWGRKGPCFPGQKSLATDLGCSIRQVKVWIADLEAFGLIRYRRRGRGDGGRGLTNEYTFLWHRIFDVQIPKNVRLLKCENGHFEVQKPALSKCEDQPPLYKEETRPEETHTERSSSSEVPEQMREAALTITATTAPPSPKEKKTEYRTWWTPEELNNAKGALAKHGTMYSSGSNLLPDSAITTQVLRNFSNFAEFTAWLEDLVKRFPADGIRTWGFYDHDARSFWPSRRADVEAELAAANRERERKRADWDQTERERERKQQERAEVASKCRAKGWASQKALGCERCAGFGRDPDTEQICSCDAGKQFEHESTKCLRCDHSGIVDLSKDFLTLVDWCECEHAIARKKKEPEYVEKLNTITRKMLSMRKHPKPLVAFRNNK